jgi:hypothetical protein
MFPARKVAKYLNPERRDWNWNKFKKTGTSFTKSDLCKVWISAERKVWLVRENLLKLWLNKRWTIKTSAWMLTCLKRCWLCQITKQLYVRNSEIVVKTTRSWHSKELRLAPKNYIATIKAEWTRLRLLLHW